ncbi:MAG: hypothetical protein IPP94_08030 [Ignavibacteria bacterium]|nr:hypothetical protein [Ignavibacteria bacterium]
MRPLFILCGVLLLAAEAQAQRGVVRIPAGSAITIPANATLCADTIFANNPGFGTLTFPNAAAICQAVVIPVELLTLSATPQDGDVLLRWSTASERNCAGYDVQRAGQDNDWRARGFVAPRGVAGEGASYTYADRLPADLHSGAVLRYRLRIVDNDGSFAYSPVVEVRPGALPASPQLHAAWPNPAADRLRIPFSLSVETPVRIAVYTVAGEEIRSLRREEFLPAGSHVLTADIAALRSGSYLLEFTADGIRGTQLIHVQR